MILGTAHAACESASAHLGSGPPADQELSWSLALALGTAAFDTAYGEGKRLLRAQALRFASPGHCGSPARS